MKKELLKAAGEAAYGSSWQSSIQRDLGLNNRQSITKWLDGTRTVPEFQPELIAILEVRKSAISAAETALRNDLYVDEKEDLTAEFYAVSEGGHLLDEKFKTLEDAKAWVSENFEDDDLYLASFYKMTLAEIQAIEVMQHFGDVYEPKKVLEVIRSGQFEKSVLEYCLIICELDQSFYGKEYYRYFLANEFNLTNTPSFSDKEDFEFQKTISYKQFIMKRIAELSQFVATKL